MLSIEEPFDRMASMAVIGDLLFYKRNLDAALRHLVDEGLGQEVDRIQDGDFAKHTDEELVSRVVAKTSVTPLDVAFDKATSEVKEATVDVTGRFEYAVGFVDGPGRVPGYRATKTIPFKGDRDLWHMKTNPWGMSPPRGKIDARALVIGIEVPEPEVDQIEGYIAGTVAKLREYLERQEAQIRQHNNSLPALALPLVRQRRARLGKAADLRKKLDQ
jgi:hypothetical protein